MTPVEMEHQIKKLRYWKPAGLVQGSYGAWLMYNYVSMKESSSTSSDEFEVAINQMIGAFNSASHYSYSLGYGLIGLLWTLHCLERKSEDYGGIFDKNLIVPVLEDECLRLIDARNYDLFSGAHGILMYLMQIGKLSVKVYERYITSLLNGHEEGELIPPSTSSIINNKKLKGINLGVPHGVAGCVLMLARLYEYEPHPECQKILEKSIFYLLGKSKKSNVTSGYFTYFDHPESEIAPLAWCYGDLSTGYAILKAGKIIQNQEFKETGISILDNTLKRNDFAKKDLSLCHGAPCIAYIYHKAWLVTGKNRYQDRSEFWVEETKQMMGKHVKKEVSEIRKMENFSKNQSLIYGYPGMHLALNTIKGNVSSEWDSWMLL